MSDWKTVRLGDVCEILDSKRIPITAHERKKGEYPYYGANGVQDYVADYIFDDELVLLAEDGGNFGSKEKPIAYRVSGKCWVNNHAHVLKPKDCLDVDYLCDSIKFYDVSTIINGATRQKLTQSAMVEMRIPLPPLETQKQIANQLEKCTSIITKYKQMLEKYDALIKSRFIEMFGDNPIENGKWKVEKLGNLGLCKNGMNFSYEDNGFEINCLGVGDFKDNAVISNCEKLPVISLNEKPSEEYLLKDNDIVFVRSNGNKELVGRSVLVHPRVLTTFSGFCIRFRLSTDSINHLFLLQFLKMPNTRKNMAGRGANIQNLNQQILSNLDIPVPQIELQNDFSSFVQQIDKSKFAVQKSLEKAETLYKSLMQEYFN